MSRSGEWHRQAGARVMAGPSSVTRRVLNDLIERRRAQGLTQQDLADVIGGGTGQSSVAYWEAYAENPTLSMLERYARGLGLRLRIEISVSSDKEEGEGVTDV